MTISAGMVLWLYTVRFTSALYALLLDVFRLVISLLAVMSKAFPVLRVSFQSLGVWPMLSSPINSREPSESSVLNTLKIPLGRAIPNPFALVFQNSSRFAALRLVWEQRPELILMRLYFLMGTLQTLGMNSTCFWELSLRETGSLRVYKWKSEKDCSLKEGGAPAITALSSIMPLFELLEPEETVFTSPAISFSLALEQRLPLRLSIVTHPPMSPLLSSEFKVIEQSAFQEKPVVRQATSQLVVSAVLLKTCQLRVGSVKKPAGREGKLTASTLFKTYIPFLVLRMYPLQQPSRVPFILTLSSPNLAKIVISLSIYFWSMAFALTKLASKFCQQTLTSFGAATALKVTVSGCMLAETSVKES